MMTPQDRPAGPSPVRGEKDAPTPPLASSEQRESAGKPTAPRPARIATADLPIEELGRGHRVVGMSDHAEIRAALEAATPGPWAGATPADDATETAGEYLVNTLTDPSRHATYVHAVWSPDETDKRGSGPVIIAFTGDGPTSYENRELIANAPKWLAELLAENERLREACTDFENAYVGEHADRVAAMQEIERLQEDARSFAAALDDDCKPGELGATS